MKKSIITGVLAVFLLGSCGTHEHNHAEEGHDHEAEAAHGHDEHDHEAEEAHKGASNEIVLTPEKAEAAGKTYYVRMRSYVKVNGKKVYGNWSAKKCVKIKK